MIGEPPRTAATRRTRRRLATHLSLAVLTALACAAVAVVGPGDFSWTRRLGLGTGYAGLGFLLFTLVVSPWNVLRGRRNPVNVYLRRDVGIWAAATAAVHVVFGLQVHMGGEVWRYFLERADGGYAPLLDAFGATNYGGAAAMLLLAVLLLLSSDAALRRLRTRRWKLLQRLNYASLVLVVGHTLIYQVLTERATFLVLAVLGGAVTVAAMQAAGYVRVRSLKRARSAERGRREWTEGAGASSAAVPPRAEW